MAMTLRLDDDRESQLRTLAEREGRSMHSVVVAAIDSYLAGRDAQEFAALADEIIDRHAALLDRLAQ